MIALILTAAFSSLIGYGIGYARAINFARQELKRAERVKRLTPPLHGNLYFRDGPIRFTWEEDPDAAIDALIAATKEGR